ncbi:DUF3267 domain-containing protein [Oceanobacillus rekensis]|uniref:DUF3267 domain-containing protein n=1 Tax=Oceanobacillus rekensis TaxID=937927 RepID=UPI000B4498B1|nr:DUF3267 domain-containing protein [Oceanobacillus rekensis]
MNCWKSINIAKEFGQHRLLLISLIIGVLSFIFLFVPISLLHGTTTVNESGILPFMIALLLLPFLHSFVNMLSLITMQKQTKIYFKSKVKCFPSFHTEAHLSKLESLMVSLAPTLFITLPGLIASLVVADFYVYILLFTCIHIGITFIDFLHVLHIIKAPRRAYIQNAHDGLDILVKE